MVTLVGALDTLGDAIAIQRVSWRRPRAIDFRSIQGAISADGVGNLLSGLAGTVPNMTYGMSISVAELTGVAARKGWSEDMEQRLRAVGEETVQILARGEQGEEDPARRLLVIAGSDGVAADLEFLATTDEANIEDQLVMLSEGAPSVGEETPLRLLRHYASSIRHRQYHDIDVLLIRVESAAQPGSGID